LFLDACVWLDLAENFANEPLLSALDSLSQQGVIKLVVPSVVREEFARNKERIVRESGRSLSGALKRARVALYTYGDPKRRQKAIEVINDVDHKLSGANEVATKAVQRIETLFQDALDYPTNRDAMLAAAARAMEKRAPFHNGRNNFADAVIIELYGQMIRDSSGPSVFITRNVRDFSATGKDQREPHSDFATLFRNCNSRYFIKLVDALRSVHPNEFAEVMYESELSMEPRKASEISAAIEELTDRVWYDRHMVSRGKLEAGKMRVIAKKDFLPQLYRESALGRIVVDEIWAGALKSAQRVEKKYGKENLGPCTKFEWGMINGKLSALRWVFGEEWDELYT
jgi:hypothetical protein